MQKVVENLQEALCYTNTVTVRVNLEEALCYMKTV